MEEAVVGAFVGATIQVVLQNLFSVISTKKIDLDQDFKKDLEKLEHNFMNIQNILYDAAMQQVTNMVVKQWLKDLEGVAFEAYYVLDEFDYELLREESNNMETQTITSLVMDAFNQVLAFNRNSKFSGSYFGELGGKIKDINAKLEAFNQEATSFGSLIGLVGARAPHAVSDASAVFETDSFTVDPIFIGRDNDVPRIVEMLTKSRTDEGVFSILPIVGMGGLGKTSLTRKVYHDEKIKTHFGTPIWVHVSKNFEPVSLLKKILTNLTGKEVEAVTKQVVLKKLQEALGDKTYLLVLDDLWNQDWLKWDEFINSLRGISHVKGNGIIVTTRNTEVASIVHTLPIYVLKGLPDDNCWSIIKAKTFGNGDVPSEFETIGRNIAKRCQGLPLAANVVGGVLRRKLIDDWLSIQEDWLSDVEGDENNILKILKLSFDHLPSPSLKKCFAYCSIFPKGYPMDREKLIELWMAEGFLQADKRNDMEAVGNKFFNLLLQNSLLQVVKRDDNGNIIECNMHDLVHDLACSVLGSSKVLYVGPQRYGYQSSPIPKEAKHLRTLFVRGQISDNMFSDFKCLHALTLEGNDVRELPSSIRELIHLRYLDISSTKIGYLPDWIGELYHLQTLRANNHPCLLDCLRKLPSTLNYLISLRHLYTPISKLSTEIGRLTSLRTLPYFGVGNEEGCRIKELGSLQNLKGELKISNLDKVHDKEEAKSAYLSQKPNIVKLCLEWNLVEEGEINDENVLEGLQPHPKLKSLHIYKFKGRSFPSWTLKMAVQDELGGCWVGLNNLMEIKLSSCTKCEEIPMLGHLPHLKSLRLFSLSNVRSIGSSFYGIDSCSSNNNGVCKDTVTVFPALERLKMEYMSNLTEWVEIEFPSAAETQPREVKAFPRLKQLDIVGCKGLINLPCGMLKSCAPSLESLSLVNLSSLTNLSMVIDVLQEMPRLTELEIVFVPQFFLSVNGSSIGIGSFRSLQQLTVCSNSDSSEHCDSLPDRLQHLNALSKLELRYFGIETLPEWFGNLSSLETLILCHCEKLRRLPSKKAMGRLTKLTKLDIQFCPLLRESDDSEWPKISHIPYIEVGGRRIPSHGSVSETPN